MSLQTAKKLAKYTLVGWVSCGSIPDEEGVILDLDGLDTLALVVQRGEAQASSAQLLNVLGVDLVAMTVALLNNLGSAIHGAQLTPFRPGLEVRSAGSQSHGTTHFPAVVSTCNEAFYQYLDLLLGAFRHENDDLVVCFRGHFFRNSITDTHDMTSVFHDSHLEAKANA